ncbi:hypothetical protein GGF31_001797 [Allomyces arbusculus]|nr:hypothetical protein GGF31_001797 [Allomyces arbusculus]
MTCRTLLARSLAARPAAPLLVTFCAIATTSFQRSRRHLHTTTHEDAPAPTRIPPGSHTSKLPALVFDIDGVLIQGGKVLPEARRALAVVNGDNSRNQYIPHLYLTNGGGVTEEAKAAELEAKFGVPVRADQTVLSHTPMQDLAKQFHDKWVLAVGAEGMNGKRVLERYGFTKIVTPAEIHAWNPTIYPFGPTKQAGAVPTDIPDVANIDFAAILVLHDSRDWGTDLQIMVDVLRSPRGCLGDVPGAQSLVEQAKHGRRVMGSDALDQINTQHVPIYFSNPDFLWANAFPMPRFGQGALKTSLKAIWRELVGQDLVYQSYGKPEYLTYAYAFRRLHQEILRHQELPTSLTNNDNEHFEVYAVGDNPHADILGANRHGWHSLLVRTGVYQAGTPAVTPTAIVDHVEGAVQLVWDRHFRS